MTAELGSLAAWWAFLARYYARQLWDSLPGPWPVRVLLIGACLAIPGPADEIALAAVVAACRARKRRAASPAGHQVSPARSPDKERQVR